jgi:hypothetical protein
VLVLAKRLRSALRNGVSGSALVHRRTAVREALAAEAEMVEEEAVEEEEKEEESEERDELSEEVLAHRLHVKELFGELADLFVR